MVNHKKKTSKRTKATSNTSRKEKRTTAPTTLASDSLDHDRIPVVTSLPPAVDGHLRCFLQVSVPTIHWIVYKHPTYVQVRLKWWGEDHGDGVLFRPIDDNASDQGRSATRLTSVRYAVCSGPRQFNAYLKDMGPLIFDVVHGPSLTLLGQARLADVSQLSASTPVQGFFDVMSTLSSPEGKIAQLYIALRFESISVLYFDNNPAAYNQISSSIPTVDMEIGPQRRRVDESDIQPTPPPLSLNPATPIVHPRQTTQDTDLFVSPAALSKGVTFAPNSPERLEYTAEHSLMLEAADNKPKMDITEKQDNKGNTPSLNILSPRGQMKANRGTSISSELIAALLQRGEKLREAMVMSVDEDNDLDEPSGLASVIERRNTSPGKLFKAILTSSETDYRPEVSGVDESGVTESVFLHNNKAVDLVLGEEYMHYMEESPVSSPESSIVSELGDPLYDESLLKDLFYTTPAIQVNTDSDSTVSTDDDDDDEHDLTVAHNHTSQEKKENKRSLQDKHGQHSPQIIPGKENVMKSKTEEHLYPKPTKTDDSTPNEPKAIVAVPYRHSPMNTSTDSSLPSVRKDEASNPNSDEFIENLGPEKLTALGRVDAARVMVDNLRINGDKVKPGTYFVEYNFPTSTPTHRQEDGIAMASELTRIASKRLQDGVVLFNHRSVFPVLFNSTVIDVWWRKPLTFRLYFRQSGQRMPAVIGEATFPLKAVLQSDSLSSSASLQIKQNLQSKHDESTSSASVYCTSGTDDHPCTSGVSGPLLVKLELMTDGKQLHIKPNMSKKPPLPMTTTPTKTADHIQVTKPTWSVGQVFGTACYRTADAVKPTGKSLPQAADKLDGIITDKERDPLTLYTLLWIPDGSSLHEPGDWCSKGVSQGLVTKSNLYLVCRMFWCDEVSKSRVCWGTTNPPFGFKLVAPVILNSSMLQRVCNNFMVTEVWNRIGPGDSTDKLLGLAKLPLQQLYLSYRDPKITRTLLKSKYPVVAVDDWIAVTNPFTRTQHGHLKVLLALGSEEQIAAILALKCGGEVPVGMMPRTAHHLDTARGRDDGAGNDGSTLLKNQELVEHQFDITVEDIRGLSVFGSTVWGETDCFVQYHFPFQKLQASSETMCEEIPKLQPHRTPTTLCVPDPAFHDVTRHAFKLPYGLPVQKHLLAAFTGSWVAAPSVPGSGGVPFELWRRYYYPNTRDQMVAKAILPIAKLCAMVTMQRQGQGNIQTFSLPLTVLVGDEMDGMRQDRVHGTGLLDVTVKYQQVRLGQLMREHAAQREEQNVVCLSLEVLQACGLKATARLHAKSRPALSYPAEVGVNAYIVIHFPLGKKQKHVTRTVARTFSPEFSYNADILLPVIVPSGVAGKGNVSLAEQLEDLEMTFEVWHQMSCGKSGDQVIRSSSGALPARNRDVLLGVGRVPLITLLTHKTGVRGWYPIYMPSNNNVHDATPDGSTEKVVGGLELSIHFCEAEDRNQVIHVSRGVGWSPLAGVECEDAWLDKKEVFKETSWKFSLKINKSWIPPTEVHSFFSGATSCVKAYARYKLYNKAPICSRMLPVKDGGDGKLICELKHSKDTMLPVSPLLTQHVREESLEIQLWLSNKRHNAESKSKKRDRLLGSAFVDVSPLLASHQRTHRQISGVYPLFRSGASDLFGACVHVQASLNLCSEVGSDLEYQLGLEQHASSEEYVDAVTPVEDVDSSTMISSQDHTDVKPLQHITKEQVPVTEPGDDTFTAHVIIEQALHLPTVPGVNGERSMPNVYVSYQTHPSLPPSCTSVVISSTKPSWEFQKLERISCTSLQSQGLVFKLWHTVHDKVVQTKPPESTEERQDSSCEDRVIGFVLFDLSPLLAGMRQLIGWYNVTDFNGDCKGQIKLGVSPVIPVSPPRSLTASTAGYLLSQMQDDVSPDTSLAFNPGNAHKMFHHDNSEGKLHKDKATCCHLSGQQEDLLTGVKPPAGSEQLLHDLPVCSTSLLFSQLRQNMKDLDTLQQNLNFMLRSSNVSECASHLQKESLVVEVPRHSFLNANEASAASVKTLQTTNTGKAAMEGLGSEVQLPKTDFIESEVVSVSGRPSGVSGDGHSLAGRISPKERNLQKHGQCSYETSDKAMVMGRTETYNSQDRLPCYEGHCKEHPQHDIELDSFFSLEKNMKRSLVEDQQLSVDSELSSVSDLSGEYSVSGCVQDLAQPTQFTDIKDSWLSSEDEETTTNGSVVKQLAGLSVPSSAIDNERDTMLPCTMPNDAKESMFHGQEGDGDSGENDVGHDSGNHEEEHFVAGSQVAEVDLSIKRTEDCTTRAHLATGKTPSISSSVPHEKINGFERDQENDYNCVANSADVQFNEMPRNVLLSGYPMTTVTLPNFFMPSEQLAESMRALRLGSLYHNNSSSQSKLLARSNHLKTDQHTKGKLHEMFVEREPVHNSRRDERPPISNSEADRIARIFNSGSI